MTKYLINVVNSQFVNGGAAFASTVAHSTLTVQASASLISWSGGDGADVTDFNVIAVNGEIGAYGAYDGLYAFPPATKAILTLNVGASGEIYGGGSGFETWQQVAISNAGTIQGATNAGISEQAMAAGAESLTNAATGQIVGGRYGIYADGDDNETQTIVNSGVIEGGSWALYLAQYAATTITNTVGGQITGGGIWIDTPKGAQEIVNAGVIGDNAVFGIYMTNAEASVLLVNSSTGRMVAPIYLKTSNSTVNINNSGLIESVDGGAVIIDVNTSGAAAMISNAGSGQIIGDYDAVAFDDFTGAVTIGNAGLISSHDSFGVAFQATGNETIENASTGIIKGADDGIYSHDDSGSFTLANDGEIAGGQIASGDDDAVYLYGGMGPTQLTNSANGRMVGDRGIYDYGCSGLWTLHNAGVIDGLADDGVFLQTFVTPGAATIGNAATGQIIGSHDAIDVNGYAAIITVHNSGLMSGASDDGVYLGATNTVTIRNAASGSIEGYVDGIDVTEYIGGFSLNNAGLISGAADGLYANASSGDDSIANSGRITGATGIFDNAPGTTTRAIANSGAIVGASGFGVEENASGLFNLNNSTTGEILGSGVAIYDGAASGTRRIVNAGYIRSSGNDAIWENVAGDDFVTNLAGGRIVGGDGYGIYADATTGALTIANAGVISGSSAAIYAESLPKVFFSNSGIVNGSVLLRGAVNVEMTGGVINGDIDMGTSTDDESYVSSGGRVTGNIDFGDSSNNFATLEAGAQGAVFRLGGTTTFNYESASASTGTTAATRDTIVNWMSSDVINLSAFAAHDTFADISQFFTSPTNGQDWVTLKGSTFALEIQNLSGANALTAANFVF